MLCAKCKSRCSRRKTSFSRYLKFARCFTISTVSYSFYCYYYYYYRRRWERNAKWSEKLSLEWIKNENITDEQVQTEMQTSTRNSSIELILKTALCRSATMWASASPCVSAVVIERGAIDTQHNNTHNNNGWSIGRTFIDAPKRHFHSNVRAVKRFWRSVSENQVNPFVCFSFMRHSTIKWCPKIF